MTSVIDGNQLAEEVKQQITSEVNPAKAHGLGAGTLADGRDPERYRARPWLSVATG